MRMSLLLLSPSLRRASQNAKPADEPPVITEDSADSDAFTTRRWVWHVSNPQLMHNLAALALGDESDVRDLNAVFAALKMDAIRNDTGAVVWQIDAYEFLGADAPDTVNHRYGVNRAWPLITACSKLSPVFIRARL